MKLVSFLHVSHVFLVVLEPLTLNNREVLRGHADNSAVEKLASYSKRTVEGTVGIVAPSFRRLYFQTNISRFGQILATPDFYLLSA